MCFYDDDYDWVASVSETSHPYCYGRVCCEDCGRSIGYGEQYKELYQQEHEECRVCEDKWSDDYIAYEDEDGNECDPPKCETCCYGETWTGAFCRECQLTRQAIHDWEIAEGCPEHASEPAYGRLFEAMHDDPHYAATAVKRFPELHEHLARFIASAMEDAEA